MTLPRINQLDENKLHGNCCAIDGCKNTDVQLHHYKELRCNGGSDVVPLCAKHHREYHSQLGHFSIWGSKGGTKVQYGPNPTYTRNLKQYRSK